MRRALLLALLTTACITYPWQKGIHSAQTENEYYIEGQAWKYVAEQNTKIDGVVFAPTTFGVGDEEVASGWFFNDEVWFWDDWVNHGSRTKLDMDELAWHEVCHASAKNDHGSKWCACMTRRFKNKHCQ